MTSDLKIMLDPPTAASRRQALDRFSSMLEDDPPERDWQSLFDENPYLLAETMPVRLTGLYRQVRLTSGIPDYVFVNQPLKAAVGDLGVIELKRPSHSIFGTYSTHVIQSRAMAAAHAQVTTYLNELRGRSDIPEGRHMWLASRTHAFVVIGRTEELSRRFADQAGALQLDRLLPAGLNIVTFDEILDALRSSVPPRLQVLVSEGFDASTSVHVEFVVEVLPDRGLAARWSMSLVDVATGFVSAVRISRVDREDETVDGKSIMETMTLAATKGTHLRFQCMGPDAEALAQACIKAEHGEPLFRVVEAPRVRKIGHGA